MHRQRAHRSTDRDHGQRGASQDPRMDVTSGQRSVLNLQQGAGNSLTGQIVQRSPQVIRRAGDKLAFEPGVREPETSADKERVALIRKIIEEHRIAKRQVKDGLEDSREAVIQETDRASQQANDSIDTTLPPDLVKFLKGKNEADTVGQHKKTLADYHRKVQDDSGWRWEKLRKDLTEQVHGIELEGEPGGGTVKIRGAESQQVLYQVHFGTNRFENSPDRMRTDGMHNVFTKRGYSQGTKPKEFVKDNNGVHTRRYVTRAVTIWHLASMFGLNLKPIKDTSQTEVEKAIDEKTGKRIDAQMPRYLGKQFAGHRDTFALRESAAYLGDGTGGREFIANYKPRTVGKKKHLDDFYDELKPGRKTHFDFTTGYNLARNRTDEMGLNERASMQVRNGSGPFQPFLSTASIQVDPTGKRKQKIIRANKGERFDTGAENQATVKVDLAKAAKQGVEIVNQHDDESHQHKIAWDRYYGKDDIKALAERFELVRKYGKTEHAKYVQGIEPTVEELKVFDKEDRVSIRLNKPEQVINKKYIKRSAPDELDEYIYSARKNREVLMQKIPISCVTEILLSKDDGKWPGLAGSVERGTWLELTAELQGKLKAYLRGSEDEDKESYENIKAMYQKAEEDKKAEGGNRT